MENRIFFTKFRDRIRKEVLLAPFTTYKIGGPAEYFIESKNSADLCDILTTAYSDGVRPVTVIGGGTNLLIHDSGIAGLVVRNVSGAIKLRGMKSQKSPDGMRTIVYVEADSGVMMNQLVRFTCDEGLSGLEMHLGLPGTVGGAVYMNSKWTRPAGAVGDAVFQASLLTVQGELRTVARDYFRFAYDYSRLQESGDTLISVVFALTKSTRDAVWTRANESIAYRRQTQPQGEKSAGCVFQNLTDSQAIIISTPGLTRSAGYLIDHSGMKGKSVGGAKVSDNHANFIVNTGNATSGDMVQLIKEIREAVDKRFGIKLDPEIRIIGGR